LRVAEVDQYPTDEEGWDRLRAYFDEVGQRSLEEVVARGTPAEVAGKRIAEFNDMLIDKLRKRADDLRSRQAG
jgi:hypothetical protein